MKSALQMASSFSKEEEETVKSFSRVMLIARKIHVNPPARMRDAISNLEEKIRYLKGMRAGPLGPFPLRGLESQRGPKGRRPI